MIGSSRLPEGLVRSYSVFSKQAREVQGLLPLLSATPESVLTENTSQEIGYTGPNVTMKFHSANHLPLGAEYACRVNKGCTELCFSTSFNGGSKRRQIDIRKSEGDCGNYVKADFIARQVARTSSSSSRCEINACCCTLQAMCACSYFRFTLSTETTTAVVRKARPNLHHPDSEPLLVPGCGPLILALATSKKSRACHR